LGGGVLLAASLDPSISVASSNNLVGELLQVFLSCGILESATDQTLGSEHCVFRVCDSLYI